MAHPDSQDGENFLEETSGSMQYLGNGKTDSPAYPGSAGDGNPHPCTLVVFVKAQNTLIASSL